MPFSRNRRISSLSSASAAKPHPPSGCGGEQRRGGNGKAFLVPSGLLIGELDRVVQQRLFLCRFKRVQNGGLREDILEIAQTERRIIVALQHVVQRQRPDIFQPAAALRPPETIAPAAR